jgi:hypothetical protein
MAMISLEEQEIPLAPLLSYKTTVIYAVYHDQNVLELMIVNMIF